MSCEAFASIETLITLFNFKFVCFSNRFSHDFKHPQESHCLSYFSQHSRRNYKLSSISFQKYLHFRVCVDFDAATKYDQTLHYYSAKFLMSMHHSFNLLSHPLQIWCPAIMNARNVPFTQPNWQVLCVKLFSPCKLGSFEQICRKFLFYTVKKFL